MVPHGEFPYNSLYTTPDSNTSYFSNLTRFKINDSGECIIAMNLNRGNVSPDYTHYVFYTSDYGENLQIITANNVGLTAYALFGCDEQMTKMVYMTASTNLYSITAPFSTSTPTLVSSDFFLIIEILLCRGDGLHLSFQEWLVVFRQYTYLNIRVRRGFIKNCVGPRD
jgi:hypothetical protein